MTFPEYVRGAQYLNEHEPFFYTNVVNIGKPVANDLAPAPMLVMAADDFAAGDEVGDFQFVMAPAQVCDWTDEVIAGGMCHEALHILKQHLSEQLDERYTNKQALMIAHEVIVNDTAKVMGLPIFPDGYFGPKVLGMETHDMSTWQVYQLLDKMMPQDEQGKSDEQQNGHGSGQGSGQGDGQRDDGQPGGNGHSCGGMGHMTKEQAKAIEQAVADSARSNSHKLSGKQREVLAGQSLNAQTDKGKVAGTGRDLIQGPLMHWARENRVPVKWAYLIAKVNPDYFLKHGTYGVSKTSWNAPKRKTAYLDKRGYKLPTTVPKASKRRNGGYKPHIVLALDFSGSVPASTQKALAKLANSIPDAIDVSCITFSTYSVEFNPKSDTNMTASGGTDFSAVEKYVRLVEKDKGRYPSAVVVITDGMASFDREKPTNEQLKKNWTWVMLPGWSDYYGGAAAGERIDIKEIYDGIQ